MYKEVFALLAFPVAFYVLITSIRAGCFAVFCGERVASLGMHLHNISVTTSDVCSTVW